MTGGGSCDGRLRMRFIFHPAVPGGCEPISPKAVSGPCEGGRRPRCRLIASHLTVSGQRASCWAAAVPGAAHRKPDSETLILKRKPAGKNNWEFPSNRPPFPVSAHGKPCRNTADFLESDRTQSPEQPRFSHQIPGARENGTANGSPLEANSMREFETVVPHGAAENRPENHGKPVSGLLSALRF